MKNPCKNLKTHRIALLICISFITIVSASPHGRNHDVTLAQSRENRAARSISPPPAKEEDKTNLNQGDSDTEPGEADGEHGDLLEYEDDSNSSRQGQEADKEKPKSEPQTDKSHETNDQWSTALKQLFEKWGYKTNEIPKPIGSSSSTKMKLNKSPPEFATILKGLIEKVPPEHEKYLLSILEANGIQDIELEDVKHTEINNLSEEKLDEILDDLQELFPEHASHSVPAHKPGESVQEQKLDEIIESLHSIKVSGLSPENDRKHGQNGESEEKGHKTYTRICEESDVAACNLDEASRHRASEVDNHPDLNIIPPVIATIEQAQTAENLLEKDKVRLEELVHELQEQAKQSSSSSSNGEAGGSSSSAEKLVQLEELIKDVEEIAEKSVHEIKTHPCNNHKNEHEPHLPSEQQQPNQQHPPGYDETSLIHEMTMEEMVESLKKEKEQQRRPTPAPATHAESAELANMITNLHDNGKSAGPDLSRQHIQQLQSTELNDVIRKMQEKVKSDMNRQENEIVQQQMESDELNAMIREMKSKEHTQTHTHGGIESNAELDDLISAMQNKEKADLSRQKNELYQQQLEAAELDDMIKKLQDKEPSGTQKASSSVHSVELDNMINGLQNKANADMHQQESKIHQQHLKSLELDNLMKQMQNKVMEADSSRHQGHLHKQQLESAELGNMITKLQHKASEDQDTSQERAKLHQQQLESAEFENMMNTMQNKAKVDTSRQQNQMLQQQVESADLENLMTKMQNKARADKNHQQHKMLHQQIESDDLDDFLSTMQNEGKAVEPIQDFASDDLDDMISNIELSKPHHKERKQQQESPELGDMISNMQNQGVVETMVPQKEYYTQESEADNLDDMLANMQDNNNKMPENHNEKAHELLEEIIEDIKLIGNRRVKSHEESASGMAHQIDTAEINGMINNLEEKPAQSSAADKKEEFERQELAKLLKEIGEFGTTEARKLTQQEQKRKENEIIRIITDLKQKTSSKEAEATSDFQQAQKLSDILSAIQEESNLELANQNDREDNDKLVKEVLHAMHVDTHHVKENPAHHSEIKQHEMDLLNQEIDRLKTPSSAQSLRGSDSSYQLKDSLILQPTNKKRNRQGEEEQIQQMVQGLENSKAPSSSKLAGVGLPGSGKVNSDEDEELQTQIRELQRMKRIQNAKGYNKGHYEQHKKDELEDFVQELGNENQHGTRTNQDEGDQVLQMLKKIENTKQSSKTPQQLSDLNDKIGDIEIKKKTDSVMRALAGHPTYPKPMAAQVNEDWQLEHELRKVQQGQRESKHLADDTEIERILAGGGGARGNEQGSRRRLTTTTADKKQKYNKADAAFLRKLKMEKLRNVEKAKVVKA